jgi:HAD superfamily hydrolase (TIGR01662 family)
MKDKIKAICFDQGGTLLYRVPLNDSGKADYLRIMELAGIEGDPIGFGKKLTESDNKYKDWSLSTNIEASEENIWTHWLLPEIDPYRLKDNYDELTLLFSHSKGTRVFRSDAEPTIAELHKRGYLIAVITNTVSLTLVPSELKSGGIWKYISANSMSSVTSIRKPKPDMFLDISKQLNVKPINCVYIGDAPNRDVEGPRAAGYGLSILLKEDPEFKIESLSDEYKPDLLITSLNQLLEIFNNPN